MPTFRMKNLFVAQHRQANNDIQYIKGCKRYGKDDCTERASNSSSSLNIDDSLSLRSISKEKRCCYEKMNARKLKQDILTFLNKQSLSSTVFKNILEYVESIMPLPDRVPPASYAAISKLENTRIYRHDKEMYKDTDLTCSICAGHLIDGVALTRMPCGHIYHINCIVSSLSERCTCPECQYEISTDDHTYEIGRMKRMKNRPIVQCGCFRSNHTCFLPSLLGESSTGTKKSKSSKKSSTSTKEKSPKKKKKEKISSVSLSPKILQIAVIDEVKDVNDESLLSTMIAPAEVKQIEDQLPELDMSESLYDNHSSVSFENSFSLLEI